MRSRVTTTVTSTGEAPTSGPITTTTSPTSAPPAPAPAPAATPTPSPRRLLALDVLRGIAILGTLLTNIWIFSSAGHSQDVAEAGVEPSNAAVMVETGLGLVTDGKFIGLLTIMFGIGLEIQRQSALRRGAGWPGRYPWRAGILIVEGALNYLFVFEFDVLMGYGLTALAVSAIMITRPRAQKIWMIIGVSVHVVVIVGIDLLMFVFGLIFAGLGEGDDDWAGVDDGGTLEGGVPVGQGAPLGGMGGWAEKIGAGNVDSYWAGVAYRWEHFMEGRAEIPVMLLMGLGLFLVGAHLYRAGVFEAHGARLRRRIMLLSFGVGLPLDWFLRLGLNDEFGLTTRYVTSAMVAFGVLALVAQFYVGRTRTGVIGTCLSAVGRMALSCYILQNLLASVIFYDWGFGVANLIAGPNVTWWTLGIYAGLAAGLVLFSLLWLRFFSRGPFEWLWHALYRGVNVVLDARAARRAPAHPG
ncbi:MAG: DUF418 domain-containing protein, partial [Micrococcus sp.]|nr:DUF418 domain-containing protein [Micrococcus sp.]